MLTSNAGHEPGSSTHSVAYVLTIGMVTERYGGAETMLVYETRSGGTLSEIN